MLPATRRFRLFFIGRAVDLLGSAMTPVVLTLAVLETTGSASRTGVVLAANIVPALVLMLVGGVVADRLPRARILTVTCAVSAVIDVAMAAVLLDDDVSIALLTVLAAASGMVGAFTTPALRGIVPDLVARDDVQRANAALSAVKNGAKILGPTLAGVLVAVVGGGWALVVDAATFIVAAVLFSRLPGHAPGGRRRGVLADLRHGFAVFRRLRWVWTLSVCYAVINLLLIGPWQVLGPALVQVDHSVALWGVLLSVRAAGLLVASILLVRLRLPNPLVTGLVMGSVSGLPLVALGASAPVVVLFVVVFVSACGTSAAGITYDSALQSAVPRQELSRVSSIDDLLSFATVPLSQALAGPLATVTGTRELLLVCGLGVLACHLLPLSVRQVREVTRSPAG